MAVLKHLGQLAFCLVICWMFPCNSLAEAADKWEPLFNGKDLSGWRVAEHPDSVSVKEGQIVVDGPRAHAFFVGSDGKADFQNFHFRAQVRTAPGSNSGIYFHTQYQEEGWPGRGYEAQVNNTHRDPRKTGGLYAIEDVNVPPAKDNEWFDYEIIVTGKRIKVMVNGKTTVDYTEPKDLNRPERQLGSGTFALQSHDPQSVVYYRKLEVKRLP